MNDMEKENQILKAQLAKQTQRASLLTAGIFLSSFTSVSVFVYLFFDRFEGQNMFEVELVCAALATGIILLLAGLAQKLLFGDVMADYPDIEMPKIDKKKDSLLILLTVLSVYLIQLIGYFVVFKLFK